MPCGEPFSKYQQLTAAPVDKLQLNYPTDDTSGIAASTLDGIMYGSSDAVIGISPDSDNVQQVSDRLYAQRHHRVPPNFNPILRTNPHHKHHHCSRSPAPTPPIKVSALIWLSLNRDFFRPIPPYRLILPNNRKLRTKSVLI